jgi:hypothetical protein
VILLVEGYWRIFGNVDILGKQILLDLLFFEVIFDPNSPCDTSGGIARIEHTQLVSHPHFHESTFCLCSTQKAIPYVMGKPARIADFSALNEKTIQSKLAELGCLSSSTIWPFY